MVAMSFGTTCRRGRHTSASGPHHVPRRARRCPRRHGGGPSEPVVVGRYYDTTTGQFLSVDPQLQQTLDPYAYGAGDPVNDVDPTGRFVLGACASGRVDLVVADLGAGMCLARTVDQTNDDIGVIGSPHVGGGIGLGGDASYYYEISNASALTDLAGFFHYLTLSGVPGIGATATYFWNSSTVRPIYGVDLGLSVGADLGIVYGANFGLVYRFTFSPIANIARGIWDGLVPAYWPVQITKWLKTARNVACKKGQAHC